MTTIANKRDPVPAARSSALLAKRRRTVEAPASFERVSCLSVPRHAHTLAGFRTWVKGGDFPEQIRATFVNGKITIDMSKEELELHAAEELSHALLIAKQIDYLGGTPTRTPKEVKMSDKAEDMLRFDLDNEKETIRNYRLRIKQADALNEFALGEVLRKIIAQEQDHLIDLADALGIDAPNIKE